MEDMVLPSSSGVEKSLIPSKHRSLVNDYVSVASQMTKMSIVKQKDDFLGNEGAQQSVPKLNSINNFPTLGGDSDSANTTQWFTVKNSSSNNINQKQQKVDNLVKKKHNEVPQKNQKYSANGVKKMNDENKKTKKEVVHSKDATKENQSILSFSHSSIKPPPPGFKQIEPAKHRFCPAPDAGKRNQALVDEFQQILTSNDQMQEFRLLSQMFRDGNYFARSYFESCKGVLGEKFNTIFPELLVLLPDIEKQQVGSIN
jgi:hypothetical protein